MIQGQEMTSPTESIKSARSPFEPLSPLASREGFPLETFSQYHAELETQEIQQLDSDFQMAVTDHDLHNHNHNDDIVDDDRHSIKSTDSTSSSDTNVSYHDASSRTSLSLSPEYGVDHKAQQDSILPESETQTQTQADKAKSNTTDKQSHNRTSESVDSLDFVPSSRLAQLTSLFGLGKKFKGNSTIDPSKSLSSNNNSGGNGNGQIESCFAAMGMMLAMPSGGAITHHLTETIQQHA